MRALPGDTSPRLRARLLRLATVTAALAVAGAGCTAIIENELSAKPEGTTGSGGAGGDAAASSSTTTSSSVSASSSATTSSSVSASSSTTASSSGTGGCGPACHLANAMSSCVNGACAIDGCNKDFGDCDQSPANGCETSLKSSDDHCGACDTPCKDGMCMGGKCK